MKHPAKFRGIISARVYSFADIAHDLGVHIRTVQTWHRKGLRVVDEHSHPYLVKGKDLLTYLFDRQNRRKCKLGEREMYCLACKTGRQAIPETINMRLTGRVLGNGEPQMSIQGRCPVCGKRMNKLIKALSIGDTNETGKE